MLQEAGAAAAPEASSCEAPPEPQLDMVDALAVAPRINFHDVAADADPIMMHSKRLPSHFRQDRKLVERISVVRVQPRTPKGIAGLRPLVEPKKGWRPEKVCKLPVQQRRVLK